MPIEVRCSGCSRTLAVGPEHAGKMARCPVCGHITPVPAEGAGSVGGSLATEPLPSMVPSSAWYMRTPEGQEYGPTSRPDLERWVAEGRVTFDCQLRDGEGGPWQSADTVFPALRPASPAPVWTPAPAAAGTAAAIAPVGGGYYSDRQPAGASAMPAAGFAPMRPAYQQPHRGPLILVFGLLGFFACFIFGLMAWVMGSNDLREMEAGRMDPSGADLTRAGMILGMIMSVLFILSFLGFFALMLLGAVAG